MTAVSTDLSLPIDNAPELPAFADLGLPADLLAAVEALGFATPTDIQAEAIPMLLSGRDVVGVAQTGTGKTAAFGLPLLAALDTQERSVQALVLTPTRELAMQVADAIDSFTGASRLEVLAVYGGSSYIPQLRSLKNGAQVVVGTPGRVMDLIERGALKLSGVRFFVLDEADEMLRMGFAEDVETIAAHVPGDRRTALFSATMPPAIRRVADTHLNNPVRISVTRPASTTSTIHQTYAVVPYKHKAGAVARVLSVSEADAAIVFVRTKAAVEEVTLELTARGIAAAGLSGDVPQRDRERLVERLRSGTLDVLVATDVAARGLDVERIGLVVNFDVPKETDSYVHRIGRTGRAGRTGIALTFLTPRERMLLKRIERATGSKLEEVELPTPADVSAHKAKSLVTRLGERVEAGRLDMYREVLREHAAANETSIEDAAAALMALAVGDEGPRPRNERDGVATEESGQVRFDSRQEREPRKSSAERGGRRPQGSGVRYRVEVGHKDGVQPGAIVGAITGEGGLRGSDIGKIDIMPSFSLVDITTELDDETAARVGGAMVAGRKLRIRRDTGPKHGAKTGGFRTQRSADSRDAGRFERRPQRAR
ncbi:DEAD/DEAH box helicase [Bogoriella caseilytica]|uniref:RNA helicase n=1 Tax=Bogoriella caseilytica TaxID=56055 RepID=A0A3N2B9B1_9MICO|nr:DEAD/DEAH box helicase [Bogoriella caseilytica]ROR71722.1 ATP-dependent RNA helicase DeaD [Bogoriella caseilytica]